MIPTHSPTSRQVREMPGLCRTGCRQGAMRRAAAMLVLLTIIPCMLSGCVLLFRGSKETISVSPPHGKQLKSVLVDGKEVEVVNNNIEVPRDRVPKLLYALYGDGSGEARVLTPNGDGMHVAVMALELLTLVLPGLVDLAVPWRFTYQEDARLGGTEVQLEVK
jgi:hypothetical protein